jgi:hypothetical protein
MSMPRRTSMSRICFGLLLVCGHLVTGAAVPPEIRVRLIDIETGIPAKGLSVELDSGIGKEVHSKSAVPPSAVPTAWIPRTSTGPPTSIDGVTRFSVPNRGGFGLKIGEISLIKVAAIYSDGVDARYVSCADKAVFRTEEVLRHGITVRNLDPWCPNKKAPDQVQAAPVRYRKGIPAAEIRLRLIDIETGKPAKGLYVRVRQVGVPRGVDVPTSVDGMVRFSVPTLSSPSREIRDTGLFIGVPDLAYRSSERYASCSVQMSFRTDEVLRYGVTGKDVNPLCPSTKTLDEVEARPGEIVVFVLPRPWWEWFKKTFLLNLFKD